MPRAFKEKASEMLARRARTLPRLLENNECCKIQKAKACEKTMSLKGRSVVISEPIFDIFFPAES